MAPDSEHTAKPATKELSPRGRMSIFRASEACSIQDVMPFEGVDEGVMAGFKKMMEAGAQEAHGERTLCLFRTGGENSVSICYAWFKDNYAVPKHSHSADCIYYILGGEMHLGTSVLTKGDGVYLPADHGYTFHAGPQGVELLEFRNAGQFNIHFKGNDERHWDNLANRIRDNKASWKSQDVPPSER